MQISQMLIDMGQIYVRVSASQALPTRALIFVHFYFKSIANA